MLFLFQTIRRDSAISFPFLGGWTVNPPASFSLFGRDIYGAIGDREDVF